MYSVAMLANEILDSTKSDDENVESHGFSRRTPMLRAMRENSERHPFALTNFSGTGLALPYLALIKCMNKAIGNTYTRPNNEEAMKPAVIVATSGAMLNHGMTTIAVILSTPSSGYSNILTILFKYGCSSIYIATGVLQE